MSYCSNTPEHRSEPLLENWRLFNWPNLWRHVSFEDVDEALLAGDFIQTGEEYYPCIAGAKWSALHFAATNSDSRVVEKLIYAKYPRLPPFHRHSQEKFRSHDNRDTSVLFIAAKSDDDMLMMMLRSGIVDVNANPGLATELLKAIVSISRFQCVMGLLRFGADASALMPHYREHATDVPIFVNLLQARGFNTINEILLYDPNILRGWPKYRVSIQAPVYMIAVLCAVDDDVVEPHRIILDRLMQTVDRIGPETSRDSKLARISTIFATVLGLNDDAESAQNARGIISANVMVLIEDAMLEICIGLQGLRLPALMTCAILEERFAPLLSSVPMYIYWNIVTTVKHFHKD